MRHLTFSLFLFVTLFGITPVTFGNEDEKAQFVINDPGQKIEVRIRGAEHKIQVSILNRKPWLLPKSIAITLREKKGKKRDLELSAIDPITKELGVYLASLPGPNEAYTGISVKIPFKDSKTVILQSAKR